MRTCLVPPKLGRCVFEFRLTQWLTRTPASSPPDSRFVKTNHRSVITHTRSLREARPLCFLGKTALAGVFASAEEMHRASVVFLVADLRLALTMLEGPDLGTRDRRARTYQNAASAYQSVLCCRTRLHLTAEENVTLDELMMRVKHLLDAEVPLKT
jgi:hypothetical protein